MKKYTFVELLVCCALLLMLCTVGVSALRANGSAKAEEAVCAAQQKNIYAALIKYTNDNAGFFPYFDDEVGIRGCKTRVTWAYRVHKYLPEESGNKNYFCPSQQSLYPEPRNRSRMTSPESCATTPETNLERYRSINYGINFEGIAGNIGRWDREHAANDYITMNVAKLVNPDQKVLVSDAWDGKSQGRYVISSYSHGSNKMNPCHENASNVLWCDGHVARVDNPHATLQNGKNYHKHFRGDK